MKAFWTLVKIRRDGKGEVEAVEAFANGFYGSCDQAEHAGEIIATKEKCEIVAMKSFSICKFKFVNIT